MEPIQELPDWQNKKSKHHIHVIQKFLDSIKNQNCLLFQFKHMNILWALMGQDISTNN
jgi:hypothetical protein